MQNKTAFVIFVLFFTGCRYETKENYSLFSVPLLTINDGFFNLLSVKNNKASVFVFLAVDCPLSQNYTLPLNNLFEKFKKDSIEFYGIIPGSDTSINDVQDFVSKYKIAFQILLDDKLNLAHYFHATKTPEVFVVNKHAEIIYKGAIDNWAVDIGKHRQYVSENYLKDALADIVNQNPVRVKETKAVGCIIERNR